MNRQCYRVIFNKARGMLMVVSEAAKSQTKAAGERSGDGINSSSFLAKQPSKLSVLALSCITATAPLYSQMAMAANSQVSVDKTAGLLTQPTILVSGNGTPVVNIRGTTADGVSRNSFSQFDIQDNGVILNNSRFGADTQIGGHVNGNFWLLFGEAKTIVNEVNSNNPTVFNGKLEVAGKSANVIIANPSGINVNGGTFINATKGTLTTGKVNYSNLRALDSITVNQGQINIGEKGLTNQFNNGSSLTDILAKSVTLNGKITGNHQDLVQVVVGENTIKLDPELYALDDKQITALNPDSQATGLALDIGQLGGVYANGIQIIGTKQGMGMSNAGTLQSGSFIRLNNNGRIENLGKMVASDPQASNTAISITNKPSDGEQGDIVNKGIIQAGNQVIVQAGRDLSGDGQIIRDGKINHHDHLETLTVTAERNLQTGQLINTNKVGDVQLVAGGKLNIDQKADVTTSGHILLSSGDNLGLNNAKLTSTGEGKSVQVYSGKDLAATNSSLTATNKDGTVSTAAQGNQTLSQVNLQADELHNQTGGKLTINQADFTSRGKHDVAIIANDGIDANGLTATVNDGHLSLEAAKANLLQAPDSDIVLNNATLKASQNVDIVADRNVSVTNTNLQGNQIRSSAGKNLQLGLTGDNQAATNVYLKAGDKLNLSTESGKLDANHIEAMANRIEVGDQSKLTAKAGDIKLSSVGNPLAASDSNNAQDIKLGNQVDLTASNAIALAAQGAISATDLHANGGNSVAMVATKGIRLDSTDATRQNRLGSTSGDIALIDQGQDGVTATNLTINAAQGKARVQSLGDITLNTTQGSNAAIQTQAITITNAPATTATGDNANKPHGKISIQSTDITASQGGIIINSQDALTLARGNLSTNGNLELHGNQATLLENVNANSQQHTAISSNTNLGISGSHITSKGILSAQGEQDTSLKDSQLQGGALLVAAKKGNLELGNNLTLATKTTDLLGNDPKLAAINGSMTVKGNNDLVYDAGKTINADGDLDLRTTGKISFKGTPGNQGNGSETNVNVTAKGSIGMTGSSVEMLGTHVTSTDGGITIAATDGNIKIGAIENTIDGVKPENRLKELNDSLTTVNHQLDILNNDSLYQTAATAKKAAQDKLDKLIKDNAATPIADFEQQQQALKTEIAAQNTQLQQRTKALDINKTAQELTDEQADITRSLKIADTPYQGIEHAGSKLSAKNDVSLVAKGGIAIEASDIDTRGKATLQSLSQLGEYRQVIDEKARADVLVPLMRLNKLSDGQKQDYLSQQLAAIDSMRFSLDDSVNQSEEMQKMRASLKELLPKAVAGDAAAKAQIDKILTARAPVTIIPVAISIEGLNDIYERGKEGDKSYSLHNNNRSSNVTADKGIVIQATGADNQDPKTVTTSGVPNNIIINSG
ncbi:filamentous hemagglutinin N-terminal domain-containing protein, partial [Moraxella atlantae]|uniref:two-partner secretion domain-containing protein n=1 Tax=Faucicola atlantae TaxID=34059 RepID=UPI00117EDB23